MAEIGTFMLYIFIAVVSSELIVISLKFKNKYNINFLLLVVAIILSLLAAFRGNTGTDSAMYKQAYYNINSVNSSRWSEFEPGFSILIKSLNYLHFSYHALFFLMSFIGTWLIIKLIIRYKNNIDVRFAVIWYVIDLYLISLNGMRQGMAVAVGIYAMAFFVEKKFLQSLILIIVASMFHTSALICLAVFGCKILFDNRHSKVLLIFVSSVIIFLMFNRDLFGDIVTMLTGSVYYGNYFRGGESSQGTLVGYFIKIFPILFLSVLNYHEYNKENHMKILFSLMFCGYLLSMISSIKAGQGARVGWYFTYLNILVIPFCLKYNLKMKFIRNKVYSINLIYIKVIMYIYIIVMMIYNLFLKEFNQVVPYVGFLEFF